MTKIEKPAAETFVSLSSKAWNKSFIRGNLCSIGMKLKFQGKGLSETLVSNIIQFWNIWKFTCKPLLIPSRYDPSIYRLFYHKSHTLYLFVRCVKTPLSPRLTRGRKRASLINQMFIWLALMRSRVKRGNRIVLTSPYKDKQKNQGTQIPLPKT